MNFFLLITTFSIVNLASYVAGQINMTILHTSILSFLPQMKFHDIVLLSKEDIAMKYAIDFTPINQSDFSTLKSLFLAHNVPAEIRIREITSTGEQEIIEEWTTSNQVCAKDSTIRSAMIFDGIRDREIKEFICQLKRWRNKNGKNPTMNLYKRNCQHFSWYARELHQSPLRLLTTSRPCFRETILLSL
jgi:hypothetical protein